MLTKQMQLIMNVSPQILTAPKAICSTSSGFKQLVFGAGFPKLEDKNFRFQIP